MGLDEFERLVTVLQRGGPWAVAAFFLCTTAYLFSVYRTALTKNAAEKQALNDRMIALTEKLTAALTVNNENHRALREKLDELEQEDH